MAVAPGGMPAPRTCTLPFPNPTLIAVVFCRCWSNGCASSGLPEPPYTEPYVRWCGRTAEVTPPPTRLLAGSERPYQRANALAASTSLSYSLPAPDESQSPSTNIAVRADFHQRRCDCASR